MVHITIDKSSQQCLDKNSCFVTFDYDVFILNYIKQLPIRVYDKDTRTWEVPVRYLDAMLEFFKVNDIHGYITDLCEDEEVKQMHDIIYKTSPYSYQKDGVEFGLSHEKWFLGDEQGLGKSKQAIDIAINKKNEKTFQKLLFELPRSGGKR